MVIDQLAGVQRDEEKLVKTVTLPRVTYDKKNVEYKKKGNPYTSRRIQAVPQKSHPKFKKAAMNPLNIYHGQINNVRQEKRRVAKKVENTFTSCHIHAVY